MPYHSSADRIDPESDPPRRPLSGLCERGERGSALVEVIVTALVMVVAGLGIFAALDGASATAGKNKANSVAAALAQEDQERLRALRAISLANLYQTRTRTVNGVPYTIVSRGEWVSDASGTLGCTSSSNNANDLMLKIVSTVSSTIISEKPVRLESLAAPPTGVSKTTQGSVAVKLTGGLPEDEDDAPGQPVEGVPVTLSGSSSLSSPTNSLGCAFFAYMGVGTYNLSISKSGYVDRQGNNTISASSVGVAAGQTTVRAYEYDRAGSINASFDTKVGSNPSQSASAETLSVVNSALSAARLYGTGSAQSSIAAGSLFPLSGGYGVYSGNCDGADPTNYDPDYYDTNPGLVEVRSGGSYDVTVREPALNLNVTESDGTTKVTGATARIYAKSAGCSGWVQQTTDDGALDDPGMPFGDYDVCVMWNGRSKLVTGIQNRNANGTAVQQVTLPASGGPGCAA